MKGSGQAGCIAAPQTVMAAILDALRPAGVEATRHAGDAATRVAGPAAKARHGALSGDKAPTGQRILAGILFMCGAGMLFPVMGGFAKILGEEATTRCRSRGPAPSAISSFMLVAFVPRFGLGMLRTRRLGTQLVRSALLIASNLSYFFAIIFIPIAKAATISLTAPLVVALLAWPMLGERTTVGRLVALGVGFVGVVIVIRPGTELFQWASLFVVWSAVCYALYQILTRRIAGIDPPETSAIYSSLVGGFGLILVLPFVWKTPARPARHRATSAASACWARSATTAWPAP